MKGYGLAQPMDTLMPGRRPDAGFAAALAPALRRHRLLAGGALLLGLAAVAAILLTGFHGRRLAAIVVPYPHELAQVSFAAAGDVIPHEAVRAAAGAAIAAGDPTNSQGWGALLSDVADVFKRADFGFVNLETPVAPALMGRSRSCSMRLFRCWKD
jgi:hypothetical protein